VSISCVLTTIAGADDADSRGNLFTCGGSYAQRGWVLRNVLLPWLHSMDLFNQIVVAGEWETGPGFIYAPRCQVYHGVADILLQRQTGFEATEGEANDWVLYLNDDTIWEPRNPVPQPAEPCSVLSPSRWTRARTSHAEPLPDGGGKYVQWHATLVKRKVTAQVPWTSLSLEPGPDGMCHFDLTFTETLEAAGIPWRYAPECKVWDLEMGGAPWR